MLSAFGSPSGGAPPASPAPAPRAAEGVPPSTTQWGASKASGSIYTPQTGVANHTVREAVAKQGFLIKSSAGKKDSVSTAHCRPDTASALLASSDHSCGGEQKGRKVVTKRENWQNRYFRVVDGPQPFIAWHKDQKVRRQNTFGETPDS